MEVLDDEPFGPRLVIQHTGTHKYLMVSCATLEEAMALHKTLVTMALGEKE